MCTTASEQAMLRINPFERLTAEKALEHPWLRSLYLVVCVHVNEKREATEELQKLAACPTPGQIPHGMTMTHVNSPRVGTMGVMKAHAGGQGSLQPPMPPAMRSTSLLRTNSAPPSDLCKTGTIRRQASSASRPAAPTNKELILQQSRSVTSTACSSTPRLQPPITNLSLSRPPLSRTSSLNRHRISSPLAMASYQGATEAASKYSIVSRRSQHGHALPSASPWLSRTAST